MSAQLCEQIALSAASPAVAQEFFSADELTTIREIDVARECPQHAVHPPTCDVNLRCGFFFDGTNNNLFNVNFFVSQYNRGKNIKLIAYFILTLFVGACSAQQEVESTSATAAVGIVNHTGNYIYSATVDGAGGGNMSAWGAGMPDVCCTSIPRVWRPGIKVLVRWDMPDGHQHIVKEKTIEVEKYDKPGSVYLHFFPNDEVRVIVTSFPGPGPNHPIPRSRKPESTAAGK